MYSKGDLIIYSGEGVCRVENVGPIDMSGASKTKLYYTLQPVYREGKIFIPVDTSVFMRPVISRQEADKLIRRIPEIEGEVYENRNLRMLNEHYQALLQSHDCEDMLQLIKAVYTKQKENLALGIPKNSVLDYITNILEG